MTNKNSLRRSPATPDPLLPLRTLAIFTASILIGVIAAAAAYTQFHQLAQALCAGAIAALGAARTLHGWTGT